MTITNGMSEHHRADPAVRLSTIGDPLVDLGLIIAFWPGDHGPAIVPVDPWDGFPTLAEMVACYAERSDRDLSAAAWYGVLACYRTGIILEGTHARALAGRARPRWATCCTPPQFNSSTRRPP